LIHILEYKVYFEKNSKDFSLIGKPHLVGDDFIFAKVEIFPKEFCIFGSEKNKTKAHGTFIVTTDDKYIKIEESSRKSKFVLC
jgi:hypothetical protein